MTSWYVAVTHPHSEGKAREHLLRQGYQVYLPLSRRWRKHARKRELVSRPLFPRYLFVGFDQTQARWRSIFSTIGVASLVCQGERPTKVPGGVVEDILAAEQFGLFDDAHALKRLRLGDSVRIARGPFADLVGQLQSLVSSDRVCVLLNILGRQVPTVVDASEVAPA